MKINSHINWKNRNYRAAIDKMQVPAHNIGYAVFTGVWVGAILAIAFYNLLSF